MPIKHQATLIRALAEITDARSVFVGDEPPEGSGAYRRDLEALARDLGVAGRVTFARSLAPVGVRDRFWQATAAVNLSPVGLFDKAALESMACGVPTIVSNPAFDPLLGEYSPRLRINSPDDHAGLAARLRGVLALTPDERAAMTAAIRARVMAAHSLDGLIARLASVLTTGEAA
jgi:glycosyltransferase involved in cell wall biosynthesis